jgi:WD40 repeat protein
MRHFSGGRMWSVTMDLVSNFPAKVILPAIRATHWVDTSGTLSGLIDTSRLTRLEAVSGFEGLNGLTAGARWVLGAGEDGRNRVLDARDGTLQAMWHNRGDFLLHPGLDPVRSVALSPDGILGASGMRSGRIWLRRVPDGEEVAALDKHQGAVDALAFQANGRLLASGSRDGTIRLWRPVGKIWSEVLTLRTPGSPVRRLRFSPDGTKLAVLFRSETAVRIWDIASLRTRLAAMRLDWDEGLKPVPEGSKD